MISIITENISLTDNRYKAYNLNKWNNGTLLITGYAGSGKTTISREIQKKYNCPLELTDLIWRETYDKGLKGNSFDVELKKRLLKIINQKNKKMILEGLHILELYKKYPELRKTIKEMPIIIVIRRQNVSSNAALKRDNGESDFININREYASTFNMLKRDLNKGK